MSQAAAVTDGLVGATGGSVLIAEDLHKSFPGRRNALGRTTVWEAAVRGVSLRIERGETLALVGESGAGKSTVGRLVLRLIEPDTGRIRFEGQDVRALGERGLRKWRRRAQIVFQDPYSSLDPRMTVGAAVAEPLKVLEGMGAAERDRRVLGLLERVGLAFEHFDRFPYEFSGGQLQRLAIARAIATNPALIVCDEPVSALDVSIRAQVLNLLRELQQEHGVAYLFISHDLSLVRAIAHRVAVMYRGRIVEEGPTRSIFHDPKHPYTRVLLSAIPVPDPRRRQLGRRASGSRPPVASPSEMPEPPELPLHGATSAGCDFRAACPARHDRCDVEAPELLARGQNRVVACHLHG